MYNERINETEEERRARRKRRLEEMKREKKRAELIQRKVIPAAVLAVLIIAVMGIGGLAARASRGDQGEGADSGSGQFASAKSGNPGADGEYVMLTMPPEADHQEDIGLQDSGNGSASGHGGTEEDLFGNQSAPEPDSTDSGNETGLLVNVAAVGAAETGHLVFALLDAAGVADAVERILDMFPAAGQERLRWRLANVLEAVSFQRLRPVPEGTGRKAEFELLALDERMRLVLREGRSLELAEVLGRG